VVETPIKLRDPGSVLGFAEHMSHPIFRRKPNASHMCARIKISHI
jgi:hypothetical protein